MKSRRVRRDHPADEAQLKSLAAGGDAAWLQDVSGVAAVSTPLYDRTVSLGAELTNFLSFAHKRRFPWTQVATRPCADPGSTPSVTLSPPSLSRPH